MLLANVPAVSESVFDFDDSVLDAVKSHMNADHRHDSLSIVRHLGETPAATAASVALIDARGVTFEAVTPSGTTLVLVPWDDIPTTRADIRHELVRMTESSAR